ncbi:hypothetical protein MIR68_003444 [Amoeboaphelidium protococcarum]|nr:hypothetical protein MIR68_003444 [Amoeboaphelidium protococcarum]
MDTDQGEFTLHSLQLPSKNSDADLNKDSTYVDDQEDEELQHHLQILQNNELDVDGSQNANNNNGKSSILSAVLNFTNSIVGAGIISLPYSLLQAGFWWGVIMMAALAYVVDWTVRILVRSSKYTGKNTYQEVTEYAFGQRGNVIISICQFVFAFGAMCAYAVIIGDTIPPVLRSLVGTDIVYGNAILTFLFSRRLIIILSITLVCFPLCLFRDISKLANTSAVALIMILIITVCIVISASNMDSSLRDDNPPLDFMHPSTMIRSIGVMSFAFVCHHNSFIIHQSLATPTLDRWSTVAHFSTLLSLLLSLVFAVIGYSYFGRLTDANILNNFSQDDSVINFARILFALNMFTTFPLECFVCREVIENFYFSGHGKTSPKMHLAITSALAFTAMTISLVTCNLGYVVELTGSIAATVLAYILPPTLLFYLSKTPIIQNEYTSIGGGDNDNDDGVSSQNLRVMDRRNRLINVLKGIYAAVKDRNYAAVNWDKILCVACVMFGVTVMIVSCFNIVSDALSPSTEVKKCYW